jgi:hypothetical protein
MFARIIREYSINWEDRPDEDVVELALALDVFGEKKKAVEILEQRMKETSYTDIMGVRAGRYKRSWLQTDNESDANNAFELYSRAYIWHKKIMTRIKPSITVSMSHSWN